MTPGVARVATSWRIIEEVLRHKTPSVFRALRKPVSEAQLRRLETNLPAKLPRDFVQSLKIHDGLRDSYLGNIRLFNYWALLPVSAILGVWKTMTDLQAECGFGGNQLTNTPQLKNDAHWRSGWVPFMDADGDKLVIDLDPGTGGKPGQIFKWSNSGSFPLSVLADSFGEWLSMIAGLLTQQQFRLDESGSLWLEIS